VSRLMSFLGRWKTNVCADIVPPSRLWGGAVQFIFLGRRDDRRVKLVGFWREGSQSAGLAVSTPQPPARTHRLKRFTRYLYCRAKHNITKQNKCALPADCHCQLQNGFGLVSVYGGQIIMPPKETKTYAT